MAAKDDWPVDEVLTHSAWIRQLARRLVADAADRDDVVQEAWIQALRHAPRAESLRPWLAGVLRNVARMDRRGEARRRTRETASTRQAVSDAGDAAPPTPEQMIERVEIERQVAAALVALAEPYRSTLLWRYYDDLSAAEIARRSGVPAGTVRWRIKTGLELLRADLDARWKGDRRRWALALVPTAAAARGGLAKAAIATIGGVLIMKATTKFAAAFVILLLLLAGGVAVLRRAPSTNEVSRSRPGVAWRVPGGIGASSAAPATVTGVVVPSWFGQRGAPLCHVAGRVTFAGAPIAGATVELASAMTDAGMLPPARRRTGADGRFDFGTQPPARFSVAATADGHSPAIVDFDARDPRSATDNLELRLGGCESALFGHVGDSSGGPIAGAQVCLAPQRAGQGPLRPCACSSADTAGAYKVCLGPLDNIVTVAAAGYGAIYDRFEYTGHRVQRDYALTPEATIVGRVVRADTNAPVAGANVRTFAPELGPRFAAPAATNTDAQGRFTIAGLAGGRHRVLAFAEGLAAAELVDVNVEPGRPGGELLLRLTPASRVSGVVTDGRDPIAGATVTAAVGQQPGMDAITQSDGSFVLDSVARGVARVTVKDYDLREPKTLVIDRTDVSGVRLRVDTMGSVAGRVTWQGKPAAGARVSFPGPFQAVYSESDGTYVLHGMPPGRYRVFAEDPETRAFGTGDELQLGKGEKRTGVDIEIKYTAAISGVVVEASGKPLAGVSVVYQGVHIADFGEDVSAPDGTFRVRNLRGSDDYRVVVHPATQSSALLKLADDSPRTVSVKDGTGEVTGVRVVVQRDHLAISGATVDGDGQPLGDVSVVAYRTDDLTGNMLDDFYDHPNVVSMSDGSFAIDNLEAATYVLRGRAGDGSEGTVRGVTAGQKNVVVTLQSPGAIDGTLVGFSSPPMVRAVKRQGINTNTVFATVEGTTFRFRGLSPGNYQVAAIGAEEDAQSVDVAAGKPSTVVLRSRAATTIRGRVYDFVSGGGVAGLRCLVGLRNGEAEPMWLPTIVGYSDDNGAFLLEGAPTGDIAVGCFPNSMYWTVGRAELSLPVGQDATCDVPVVKADPDKPPPPFGAAVVPSVMPTRVFLVSPGGPADRAGVRVGDTISLVDGVDVTKLTPGGIMTLIGQHAPGSTVRLGLGRGAQTVAAAVVLAGH